MKTFTIAKPISISIDNFYIQVLPFILFFISIFFDSANGYIQEFKGVHLPIGIAFRGFILCLTMKFKHIINSLILDYYNPNFNGICYLVFYRKIYRCSNGHRLSIQVYLHLLHPFLFLLLP